MSDQATNQNLLFGLLALQRGIITREELVAATSLWLEDKSHPLARIMLEREFLTEQEHWMLTPLVEIHLKKHHGDAQRSIAAIDAVESVRSELEKLGDMDIETSLAGLSQTREADRQFPTVGAAMTITLDDPLEAVAETAPSALNYRFRILRPHAEGGLGRVSVALDEELNREVALKEIKEQFANHRESRQRFVQEAEVTGGLEHPGIVPVYGLGKYPDGRPYYAMRLVKGDNLHDAIQRFHAAETNDRDSGERSLELRTLLGQFKDVCNAIEYAHSRGILHRDIKPANVMLGKYGETLVVDWGLAKAAGRSEEHFDFGEPTLQPSSGESLAKTQMGRTLGTPSYMSPEQAAGRLDDMGPTADVYSLGGTLYCLLTGRSALHQCAIGTALQKVQTGDYPHPREVKSDIPLALEAICLKAMALCPEDRYPSAVAIAADVERWLAGEPVSAYRTVYSTSIWGQLWQEVRRYWAVQWTDRQALAMTFGQVLLLAGLLVWAFGNFSSINEESRERLDKRVGKSEEQLYELQFGESLATLSREDRELLEADEDYVKQRDSQRAELAIAQQFEIQVARTPKVFFFLCISCIWFGCSNATREIVRERGLFQQEREIGLKVPSYYAAKLAVLGGLSVLQASLLYFIVQRFSALGGNAMEQWLVLSLASLVAVTMGLAISATAKTETLALAIVPMVVLPQVVLAGLMVLPKSNYMRIFSQLCSPAYWAYQGQLQSLDASVQERLRLEEYLSLGVDWTGIWICAVLAGYIFFFASTALTAMYFGD